MTTFHGKPCRKHGHTTRYVKRPDVCADCVRMALRERYERKQGARCVARILLHTRWAA